MRTTLFGIFEPEIISKRTRAPHMRIGTRTSRTCKNLTTIIVYTCNIIIIIYDK